MFKKKRLTLEEAKKGIGIFKGIPISYIDPDFANAVSISKQTNMYAYDAYFLDCALRMKVPLLTLDAKLKNTARQLNISILEV
jgi:predicted nucleic acid-binding protein